MKQIIIKTDMNGLLFNGRAIPITGPVTTTTVEWTGRGWYAENKPNNVVRMSSVRTDHINGGASWFETEADIR